MIYEKIKNIIDCWDPIQLLSMGAPKSEYDLEIKEILSKISNKVKYR